MKFKILILVVFLIPLSLTAQDIPSNVTLKLSDLYPNATNVKWDVEGNGKYEAGFIDNGNVLSLLFDSDANLLETETKIDVSQLPFNITDYISSNYIGLRITEAAKIVDSKGILTYEVEISKNKSHRDIIFDKNGNPMNKENGEKEDEDVDEDGED